MRYPGGKWKTYQHIINLIPPHKTYIEAFLGSGAVLKKKRLAARTIGIEIDPKVLNMFDKHHDSIELIQGDALKYLDNFPYTGDEVVYCDPPYHPSTRYRNKVYRFDFTEVDHIKFLEIIKNLPCRVLVSGYDNEMYQTTLTSWSRYEFYSKTHRDIRKEIVWFNYEMPIALHDISHLGSNFRERQNIKRRMERLKRRINNLSPPEQKEIYLWLNQHRGSL